jgi:hypothetical protein
MALTQQDVPARQSPMQQFQPANDTKKVPLDVNEPSKVITIGAGLSTKRLRGFSQPASSWRCFIDWLANPVLVLKKNNTWRMCIDYTSLNKACPKDPFVLPPIDQVIDSTAGCDLQSFLDAYSGYHQISLYEPDKDVVHHPIRSLLLCHHALNANATYQRTMQRCMLIHLKRIYNF